MANHRRANPSEAAPARLSPGLRRGISIVIGLHVLAVFVGPWAMPPHGSQMARAIGDVLSPYIQAMCLNNGYRFFAPEPGPGHLVRYEIETGDGRQIEGVFPDRQAQWPRLLYHRYFMMSEFLNSVNSIDRPETAAISDKYAESYVRHLVHEYDARSVTLYLRQHRLPSMEDVRGGLKLDDPSLYEDKQVTSWTP